MKRLIPTLLLITSACSNPDGSENAPAAKAVEAPAAEVLADCAGLDERGRFRMTSSASVGPASVGPASEVTAPELVLKLACCDGDYCVWVDLRSECHFPNDVFYCARGLCNPDGSITCYD